MTIEKMRERFEVWFQSHHGVFGLDEMAGTMKRACFAAYRAASPTWQPISTAPQDGTVVLARIPDSDVQQAVMWSAKDQCWVIQWDHWKLRGLDVPTHWMHLPEVE